MFKEVFLKKKKKRKKKHFLSTLYMTLIVTYWTVRRPAVYHYHNYHWSSADVFVCQSRKFCHWSYACGQEFLTSMVHFNQCCGSVSFWYGSGSSDPFRGKNGSDPKKIPTFYDIFLLITDVIFRAYNSYLSNIIVHHIHQNKVQSKDPNTWL